MKLRLTHLLAIGTIAAATPALAQSYTIQGIPPAPGTSQAHGIGLNDLGQACFFCETQSGPVATFFSGSQTTILEPSNAKNIATAKGIDNAGNVVGYELPDKAPADTSHALIWNNGGKPQDITANSIFPGGESALAVSKISGEVVGAGSPSASDSSETHMFTFVNGVTTDLGPSTANALPFAVNDSGVMLVNFTNGAQATFFNGAFTPIAQPPNAKATANAINDSGVIVGYIVPVGTNVPHGGLYSNGVWTDLGTLAGAANGTRAVSINSSGQIIGLAVGKLITKPNPQFPDISCILQNGTWVELNSLIPTNSGVDLNRSIPVSINDRGQILVDLRLSSGDFFGTALLTPTQ